MIVDAVTVYRDSPRRQKKRSADAPWCVTYRMGEIVTTERGMTREQADVRASQLIGAKS